MWSFYRVPGSAWRDMMSEKEAGIGAPLLRSTTPPLIALPEELLQFSTCPLASSVLGSCPSRQPSTSSESFQHLTSSWLWLCWPMCSSSFSWDTHTPRSPPPTPVSWVSLSAPSDLSYSRFVSCLPTLVVWPFISLLLVLLIKCCSSLLLFLLYKWIYIIFIFIIRIVPSLIYIIRIVPKLSTSII